MSVHEKDAKITCETTQEEVIKKCPSKKCPYFAYCSIMPDRGY